MINLTVPEQLRAALAAQKLTIYGASQIVGAETDEDLRTVHRRITSYISDRPPKSIARGRHLDRDRLIVQWPL